MGSDLLSHAKLRSGWMAAYELSEETVAKATRAVCGSIFCKGPEDAKVLLEALGLMPHQRVRDV